MSVLVDYVPVFVFLVLAGSIVFALAFSLQCLLLLSLTFTTCFGTPSFFHSLLLLKQFAPNVMVSDGISNPYAQIKGVQFTVCS